LSYLEPDLLNEEELDGVLSLIKLAEPCDESKQRILKEKRKR
jgi:hypothetical protein